MLKISHFTLNKLHSSRFANDIIISITASAQKRWAATNYRESTNLTKILTKSGPNLAKWSLNHASSSYPALISVRNSRHNGSSHFTKLPGFDPRSMLGWLADNFSSIQTQKYYLSSQNLEKIQTSYRWDDPSINLQSIQLDSLFTCLD